MASEEDRRLAQRRKSVSGHVEDYLSGADDDKDAPSAEDIARFSDVTVTCKGCGTELLDDVQECWKCGLPVGAKGSHESGLGTWVVLTAGVLILVVLGWFMF